MKKASLLVVDLFLTDMNTTLIVHTGHGENIKDWTMNEDIFILAKVKITLFE